MEKAQLTNQKQPQQERKRIDDVSYAGVLNIHRENKSSSFWDKEQTGTTAIQCWAMGTTWRALK